VSTYIYTITILLQLFKWNKINYMCTRYSEASLYFSVLKCCQFCCLWWWTFTMHLFIFI